MLCVVSRTSARGFVSTAFQGPQTTKAMIKPVASHRNPRALASFHLLSTQCDATTKSEQTSELRPFSVMDPLVVCGPSGVGKSSLIHRFMQLSDDRWGFSVSHTTRQPRPGEVNGLDYTFCERNTMEILIQQDAFLEWANVHGNMYGTSWESIKAVQRQGKRCLLDIDVQGVELLKRLQMERVDWKPKYLFVAPPDLETLHARLTLRNTETPETLSRRLSKAQTEVDYGLAEGNFDAVVVNDQLEQAVVDFETAIRRLYEA